MSSQIEMLRSLRELEKNKFYLDKTRFQNEITSFHICINLRNIFINDSKKKSKHIINNIRRVLKARFHFDNCLSMFKQCFELESNTYIKSANKDRNCYSGLIFYLGIANARLDLLNINLEEIERDNRSSWNPVSLTWIETYKTTLEGYMNNFIIYPLKETLIKFKNLKVLKDLDKNGEIVKLEVVKDQDLFYYMLFCEVFRTSEMEGAAARQILVKSQGSASSINSLKPKEEIQSPSHLPTGLRYSEVREDVEPEQYTISDPFAEGGDNEDTEISQQIESVQE